MHDKKRHRVGSYFVDVRRSSTKGKAILLIHGIGVSGNYFMPFAKVLSSKYDVHVLDMPGYGNVPKPSHPLAPYEQADIVADYIKIAGLRSAVIVGQSMGCQTATQLAARHPTVCERLILIGPTVNKWQRKLFMQAFRLFCDGFVEPVKMNLIILHDYFHMGFPAYLATSRYMMRDHIEDTLKGVNVPVCIVRGERDGIAPQKWVEYLKDVAHEAEVHTIEKAPHNVQYTKPKELFAVCENFLEK